MTSDKDATNPPEPAESPGVGPSIEPGRKWEHIGAIIVDATLQRRQNYNETVKPRVVALMTEWPDAATTRGFRQRLETGTLSDVISWPSPGRLAQIDDITCVFERQGIETIEELRGMLADDARRAVLREALAGVRHVSPKTLDYIDVLSGISADTAAGGE